MTKQPEVEDGIKSAIRDELALHPLMSIQKIRVKLYIMGYQGVNGGTLDWHYISRLVSKIRKENITSIRRCTREGRLIALKERHRLLTDRLIDIVEGKPMISMGEVRIPTQTERIAAANTIMRWDAALFFMEEATNSGDREKQNASVEKPEPIFLPKRYESKTRKWARLIPRIISEQRKTTPFEVV
jgi:hypothetical protein